MHREQRAPRTRLGAAVSEPSFTSLPVVHCSPRLEADTAKRVAPGAVLAKGEDSDALFCYLCRRRKGGDSLTIVADGVASRQLEFKCVNIARPDCADYRYIVRDECLFLLSAFAFGQKHISVLNDDNEDFPVGYWQRGGDA